MFKYPLVNLVIFIVYFVVKLTTKYITVFSKDTKNASENYFP